MLGLIDVGGGLRDAFGAGVLDACLDLGLHFSYAIGISAGAANITSFLAGQKGRMRRFYLDQAFWPETMGWDHYKKTGDYINFVYAYQTSAQKDGANPLDFDHFRSNSTLFWIGATDADSGQAVYFSSQEVSEEEYRPLAASACLPILNQPIAYQGHRYFDGGISEPIPYQKAFADGVDQLLVILTRPKDRLRYAVKDTLSVLKLRETFPAAAQALSHRAEKYNQALEALSQRKERVKIVAPASIRGLSTLSADKEKLAALYDEGYQKGKSIEEFFR